MVRLSRHYAGHARPWRSNRVARTREAWRLVTSTSLLIALRWGDVDGARESAREGLRWARQAQYAYFIAIALQHIGVLLAPRGDVNDAARLIGYVDRQYKELGNEREATETWGYEKLMAALHEQLSEAEIEKLAAEGAAWPEDQAVEAALKV
jgi:hypothetical protein